MNEQARTSSENPTFRPAKPIGWVIRGAQHLNRVDLPGATGLVSKSALELLRALRRGAGIILASNRADETDKGVLGIITALSPPVSLRGTSSASDHTGPAVVGRSGRRS